MSGVVYAIQHLAEGRMADAPCIVVCLPTSEQPLGARLAQALTARGFRVALVSDIAQFQQVPPFAALCVGITSQMQFIPLRETAIAEARRAQRPIFPLRLRDRDRDESLALQEAQWSDFTQGFPLGWQQLLLALDMEQMSRWPYDSSSFDEEVVLVRGQNGLTPPDWQVFRRHSRFHRAVTRESFAAAAFVMVVSFIAFVIGHFEEVYLQFGIVLAVLYFRAYRSETWEIVKYGPMIAITPQGFLIHEPNR